MTAVWLGPDEADAVEEVEEVLETVLEVAELLLVTLLDVAAVLLVTVLEVRAPGPSRKYPPTPATTKTTTMTTAATVVEIPFLERRKAGSGPPAARTHARQCSLYDT